MVTDGPGPAAFPGEGGVRLRVKPGGARAGGGGAALGRPSPPARVGRGGRASQQSRDAGGGCERAAGVGSAELAPRWDTCGSGGRGPSGGCSCASQTPAQVTQLGRQGGKPERSL